MNRILFLLFLLLSAASLLHAQNPTLSGEVVSAGDGEPLAFVSIAIKDSPIGTTTDIDGKFRIPLPDKEKVVLVFSYVGYERQEYVWSSLQPELRIRIAMKEKLTSLEEVMVSPRVDPAYEIVRRAVQNRRRNDPFELPSFSYNSYNKVYASLEGERTDTLRLRSDSTGVDSLQLTGYLFMSESYTRREFLAPGLDKETVLANRMSGYRNPAIAMVATDFQPISFYDGVLPFFEKQYLNPVSRGSGGKYLLVLEETIVLKGDSTFVISFEPRSGKNFNGLKGVISINSDGYAIENVIAEPASKHLMLSFRIQQKYERIEGRWFPVQLNTDIMNRELEIQGKNILLSSRSYLEDIEIAPDLHPDEFNHIRMRIADNANRVEEEEWQAYRVDSLSKREENTYRFYESLGPTKKAFLNGYMLFLEGLMLNSFKVGKISIAAKEFYQINEYEGTRLGLGLKTNEDFSRPLTLGAYIGYGFRDKALKYGGSLELAVVPRFEGKILLSYRRDVSEPGTSGFLRAGGTVFRQEVMRSWISSRMDSVEEIRGALRFRLFRFMEAEAFLSSERRDPAYLYHYRSPHDTGGAESSFFGIAEAGIALRYAPGERYTRIGRGEVILQPAYPVFDLYLGRGLPYKMLGGNYVYTRLMFTATHAFYTRGIGETAVRLSAGLMSGSVPYPYLQTGQGSLTDSWSGYLYAPGYFQTTGLYEFLSDRYAYLFLSHNFGNLLYSSGSKFFQPELVLVQHIGYGSLQNPERHQSLLFSTMEKGYFESGLLINNLIRISYADLFYVGFGGGAFYCYGAYALPDMEDNVALKASVKISF